MKKLFLTIILLLGVLFAQAHGGTNIIIYWEDGTKTSWKSSHSSVEFFDGNQDGLNATWYLDKDGCYHLFDKSYHDNTFKEAKEDYASLVNEIIKEGYGTSVLKAWSNESSKETHLTLDSSLIKDINGHY